MFVLPAPAVAALFGVLIALGAWEWGALAGLGRGARAGFVFTVMVLGAAMIAVLLSGASPGWLRWPLGLVAIFWAAALVSMVTDQGEAAAGRGLYGSRAGKVMSGLFVLVPLWVATMYLFVVDDHRPWLLLYAFVLVWAADTFAYFAGHRFGRHKLAPSVSPGKTIEGVAGGLVGAMLIAGIAGFAGWKLQGVPLAAWLALAAVSVLISVLGDLLESKFKRLAGVKDSGTLLPGHGGVCDRVDAMSAGLPIFALGWYYVQRLVT
jgi:phosphatidate cytidylyltransferase